MSRCIREPSNNHNLIIMIYGVRNYTVETLPCNFFEGLPVFFVVVKVEFTAQQIADLISGS